MYEQSDNFGVGYALGRDSNQNSGFFGGDSWWVIILLLFFWGGNGAYGNGGGIGNNYALATDVATLERKLDTVNAGLCDGFYATTVNTLNGFSGLQNAFAQGFAGLNTAIVTNGYETRLGTQQLGSQLASCCCDIKQGIQENTTQGIMNTGAIQKDLMQMNYNSASQHCQTLQAIDKLGDRVIGYMADRDREQLRDENQALRLAASQQAQNNYLVSKLTPPTPIPAYPVFPTTSFAYPSGVTFGVNSSCGCNRGCCQTSTI